MRFDEFFRIGKYFRLLTKIRIEIQKIALTKHSTISRFSPQFFVKSSGAEMRCETEIDLLGVCFEAIIFLFFFAGFRPEIVKMCEHSSMPSKENRQTLMFSATFPSEVQQLALGE